MYKNISTLMKDSKAEPISFEKQFKEADEMLNRESRMTRREILPYADTNKGAKLTITPNYCQKSDLVGFLAEANTYIKTFLERLLYKGTIECKVFLHMHFKNNHTGQRNSQKLPTSKETYKAISYSDIHYMIHKILAFHQEYISDYTEKSGFELDFFENIEIITF